MSNKSLLLSAPQAFVPAKKSIQLHLLEGSHSFGLWIPPLGWKERKNRKKQPCHHHSLQTSFKIIPYLLYLPLCSPLNEKFPSSDNWHIPLSPLIQSQLACGGAVLIPCNAALMNLIQYKAFFIVRFNSGENGCPVKTQWLSLSSLLLS